MVNKINATKNFNAGAIITTPQGNSLHRNTSYNVWIVTIGPPVFYTARPTPTQPQNLMLYYAVQL